MASNRRGFLREVGLSGAALALRPLLGARGLEGSYAAPIRQGGPPLLRLDSNENPNGPSRAALDAVLREAPTINRYPVDWEQRLRESLAAAHGVPPEWILLGCGSTEILRVAVLAFGRRDRPVVTAAPTFEEPVRIAQPLGVPVVEVPVDRQLRLQLDAMAAAAPTAGLIFCCNPNNPTATVHGADAVRRFIDAAHTGSPGATVLIDEAYHDYVEDGSYRSMISMLKGDRRLVISRTFSKVYGLAGMRIGYAVAQAETIAAMQPWRPSRSVSVLGCAAAVASLGQIAHVAEERRRNRDAKAFTRRFFEQLGYQVVPSETNFMMVDIRRDAKEFREACLKRGVLIGRAFPPVPTHARISIGTLAEMEQATGVFRALLTSS